MNIECRTRNDECRSAENNKQRTEDRGQRTEKEGTRAQVHKGTSTYGMNFGFGSHWEQLFVIDY